MDAPGGESADGYHRKGQPNAEREDEGKTERELFELKADEENRNRGRAGHESAGNAEEDDLSGRDGAARETFLDIGSMGFFVGVLEINAEVFHFIMIVRMVMGMTVFMRMIMIVMAMMMVMVRRLHIPAGAPEHPEGHASDNHGGDELEVGFRGLGIDLVSKVNSGGGDDPDEEGMGNGDS